MHFRIQQALTQHPIISVFTLFSPVLPRANRIAIVLVTAMTGLFFSAFLYAARNGAPNTNEQPLPPASTVELIIIALITTAIEQVRKSAVIARVCTHINSREFRVYFLQQHTCLLVYL